MALDRRRKLSHGDREPALVEQAFRDEIEAGRIQIPDHPTAGHRMLGPITAYDPATRTADPRIEKWQSVHFPCRTAEELGLPTEREGAMPYNMSSGTWWSHVMIVHTPSE
jgi:hypothetical protein